jgi:hypothetical protein
VQGGSVFYIALEGAHGYRARIEAFRQQRLGEVENQVPFYLCGSKLALAADVKTLIADIRAQFGNDGPTVIVIDTVNRSLAGPEDDKTLGPYVAAADALRAAFDCAVLLIHHSGYDKTHARGHTLLPAAVDTEIGIARDEQNNIVATVISMRDGPSNEIIASRLVPLNLGNDQDGDPISSCYIEALEGAPQQTKPKKPPPPLTDDQKRALQILTKLSNEQGASIRVADWRQALFNADVLDATAKNPRQEFRRIKNALTARHHKIAIDENDELVWLTSEQIT